LKKIHFLFGIVGSVWATMVFAQSAGCNGSWELTQQQRWQLRAGIPMMQVWPPVTDDKFGFTNGSACYLFLPFEINKPMPNENGTVFYQGSTAYCRSVVSSAVQQCGIM